jgi:hypothetical protein
VPRLSIIVPHRQDDERLEATILSVLENRPRDCEIIVAHDGSYLDPYQLSDEVIYVQEEQGSTLVELLNAGLMAACSPVVCAMLDGVQVTPNWSEAALKHFTRTEVTSVAPQLKVGSKAVYGLQEKALRNIAKLRSGRVVATNVADCGAPTLACGFYRRKPLLALGGWCEEVGATIADIELALILSELDQHCVCEPASILTCSTEVVSRKLSKEASYELASVASAHGLVKTGMAPAISGLISGCLRGNVASALAWASGLLSSSGEKHLAARRTNAHQQLASREDAASIKIFSSQSSTQAVPNARRSAA